MAHFVSSTGVGSQDVVVVHDAVAELLRDLVEDRPTSAISDDVRRLRETFRRRGGRSVGEVTALSQATLIAIYVGELVLAKDDLTSEFWSESRTFASTRDVGAFTCRKMLHVLRPYLESQDDGVSLREGLDAIGHDASFACFLAHAASVRSAHVRRSARMLASLTGILLAPDEWRWRSLLPPQSAVTEGQPACEDGVEAVRRGR